MFMNKEFLLEKKVFVSAIHVELIKFSGFFNFVKKQGEFDITPKHLV